MLSRVLLGLSGVLLLIAIGCSSSDRLVTGDLLQVQSEVKAKGEARFEDGSLEGFDCFLPAGTGLKVAISQRTGATFVECSVEKVGDIVDNAAIIERLLPPRVANRYGMQGFSITINTDLIGTKIERVKP